MVYKNDYTLLYTALNERSKIIIIIISVIYNRK